MPSKDELIHLVQIGGGSSIQKVNPLNTTKDEFTFVIVDNKSTTLEEARDLYFSTGRPPLDISWLLDSISYYSLVDTAKYKVAVVADVVFETQNSLAY